MSGSRTTAPRTAGPGTSGPNTTGARGAGPVCTVTQGRPVCECVCPEHIMPSATWGAPADFQSFLQPHRREVVEKKFNGTIGNVLLFFLAIAMLIMGNYSFFIKAQQI